jgi:HSP20 family protein
MANLTRFDPFGEMVTLRQAMDRLFEDSFVSPLTWRSVEGDKTEATFEHGVLTLRIPKAEEVKPRQIQIKPGEAEPIKVAAESGNGSESA